MENKRKFNIKEIFNIINLVIFLCSLVLGVLICIIYCFSGTYDLYRLVNGSFVASGVIIFLSLMVLILNQGTFDIIAVGFSNLMYSLKKGNSHKYDGVYGYEEMHATKRKNQRFMFLPILLAGIILLISAIIIYFIWKNSI